MSSGGEADPQIGHEAAKKSGYIPSTNVRGCYEVTGEGNTRLKMERHANARNAAFTLAEVLITLGIIGVVAALIMPTFIQRYRSQVLKNQFQKAYSSLSQAVVSANSEFGTKDFAKYCVEHAEELNDNYYYNTKECSSLLNKQLKIVGECKYKTTPKTYNKSTSAYSDIGSKVNPKYLLSDGTCYEVGVNAGVIGISVDINGAAKGPNLYGHDIFSFHIDRYSNMLVGIKMTSYLNDDEFLQELSSKCGLTLDKWNTSCGSGIMQKGRPCTKFSSQKGNGVGCSWFAMNDICPDDPTKKYWDCLP